MKLIDIAILLIVIGIAIGGYLIRALRKKKGKGCCCGCDSCSGCSSVKK